MFQDVVLDPGPSGLVAVEVLVLRRAVREVEGVVVRELGDFRSLSPGRVEPPDEMSKVEIVLRVDVVARLFFFRHARIEEPAVIRALRLLRERAVDVDGSEEREPPLPVEHHAEVVVGQDVARIARRHGVRRRLSSQIVGQRGQRHRLCARSEEFGVVALPIPIVRIDVDPVAARDHAHVVSSGGRLGRF